MNNSVVANSIRFLVLLLAQVVIFNNINFLGYINPYIYIIFILIFPFKHFRVVGLISSFFLGLCLDFFSDSGGVHATASVVLAYIRPTILNAIFGLAYEYDTLKFEKTHFKLVFAYVGISVLIHHFSLFSLEIFNLAKPLLILSKTLASSLFTIIVTFLLILLFIKPKT